MERPPEGEADDIMGEALAAFAAALCSSSSDHKLWAKARTSANREMSAAWAREVGMCMAWGCCRTGVGLATGLAVMVTSGLPPCPSSCCFLALLVSASTSAMLLLKVRGMAPEEESELLKSWLLLLCGAAELTAGVEDDEDEDEDLLLPELCCCCCCCC